MAEIFPIWIQEAQQIVCGMNTKKTTPRLIIVKLMENTDKEKIFKKSKIKDTLDTKNYRNVRWLLYCNLVGGRQWEIILNVLDGAKDYCQPRIQYLVKLSLKNENEIDIFRQAKADRIHCQQKCTIRNTKRHCTGWREMIPNGN